MWACILAAGALVQEAAFGSPGTESPPAAVLESARQVPVAAEADVVVVGGGTGAVAAAIEAARHGTKVFLAAPRHYLGEDMAGTLRLWLEAGETPRAPLARHLFYDAAPQQAGLPFTYKTDRPSAARHKDTSPPSRLCDGNWSDPVTESVQYDNDVTIFVDLHRACPLKSFCVLIFYGRDYGVAGVSVALSSDNEQWRDAGAAKLSDSSNGLAMLTVPLHGSARYVRCLVKKAPQAKRMLLGEIVIESSTPPKRPQQLRSTTPLMVKRALHETLKQAGVRFLYGCCATDLLRDDRGRPAGVVIANRAGRQAVRAKVVIDATQSALLARAAGVPFRASATGRLAVRYVVLAREARSEGPAVKVRKLDMPVEAGRTRERKGSVSMEGAAWYEYTLSLSLANESWPARANLDQTARDMTYVPSQLYSADQPFFVFPQSIHAVKTAGGTVDAQQLDLDVFRPQGIPGLWVLGPCADMSRKLAERLLRPATWIEIGTRVGAAAAVEAQAMVTAQAVEVVRPRMPASVRDVAAGAAGNEIHELLAGLRPLPQPALLPQPAGLLPVLGTYDVVVVGGGTAGAPAGIAAARQGAKTLVIEYLDGLGGVGTLGMIGGFWYGNRVGFTSDVPQSPTEVRMEWYRSQLRKAGADIWFATLGCGAVTEGNRVRGVVVVTPYGRGVVLAKTVVDATGNADMAIAAGAKYAYVEDDYAIQNAHLPSRNPGQSYLNGDRPPIDDADPQNVRLVIDDKLRRTDRDFDVGQLMDTRERRRIVGDFTLDWLDVINRRTFPDAVVYSCSDYDSHGYQIHPYFALTNVPARQKFRAYVPYRCLLPQGLDGILVVGIAMSAHRDAMPITRMQPDQGNLGYAAGVAAAMASRQGITPRRLDVKALQRHLVAVHNLPASVLTDRHSFPLPEVQVRAAVKRVTDDYHDVHVLLAQPREAVPLLQSAYAKAEGHDKLIYAHVLAAMGDGSGVPTLLAAIGRDDLPAAQPGRGSGGRYGMIRTLGYVRDRRAVPLLTQLAQANPTAADFQLVRALAFALGRIADPAAAPALANLLERSQRLGRKPQSLMVACALYRCGDHKALAKRWLERCAGDDENTLARLAWQVLSASR
jgi:NADPH-dependent 2,4-dienoyl-CoA reductase/sulfur reductase-like enzyme